MLVCFYGEIYLSYLVKEILLGSLNSGLTIVAVRLFNPTFRSLISGLCLRGRLLEIGREGEELTGRLKTIKNVAKRSLYQAPRNWGKRIVKSYRKTDGGRGWLGTD